VGPPYHLIRLKIEHVGYETLRGHYPALFVSSCLDDGRAAKFFQHRWRDEQALLDRSRRAAEKGLERSVLEALRRYHLECDAPKESMAALEKLGRGAAAVVTGQQPSAGWGPLYNLYKALAAIKVAQAVDARGIPCVAVFWNHSDDVARNVSVAFPDRENQVREVPLPPGEPGVPLYETGAPEALRMFASVLVESLPRTEFAPALEDLVRSSHKGSVAEAFARVLFGSLGSQGLVVLEPRHLEGERASKFFSDHLADPDRLARAVEAGRRAVVAEAFEDHLGRDVGLDLFEIRGDRRARVERPGPVKGRLSAGVALRPILQDAVLPTCAYVGGPSEVGYQAELLPAYRAFGVEPPVVFPRITGTLLEPKVARLVEKAALTPRELFGDEHALAPHFRQQAEEDAPEKLEALALRMTEQVEELTRPLVGSPSIAKAKERTAGKVGEALAALAARVREELARQETTGRGQLAKLLAHLRPEGKLQERVFTPLYYAALFGPEFIPSLATHLDPFVPSHQLITIPP